MANQRWIEARWDRLLLVEELDGAAYLRALDRKERTTWETDITLAEVAKTYGKNSRLYAEALAAIKQREEPTHG